MNNGIKQIIYVILLIMIIFIVTFTFTYAYFKVDTISSGEELSVTAGSMKLVFSDVNDSNINASLNFGESKETYFTIENTGTLDAYANILWNGITNTYLYGSLVYTLEYSESLTGDYRTIVENKNIPKSEKSQLLEMKNGLLIPAKTKYYYKLTITLVNSTTTNQTEDLKASFNTGFIIEEGTDATNQIISGDLNTIGSEVAIGNEHFYVISEPDENGNINLFAKYNLAINSGQWISSDCENFDNPTGMQDELAKGWVESGKYYGTIAFSSTNYWYNSGLKSEYGTSFPAYVYDENSYIYEYVEDYVSKINSKYYVGAAGRLISYEEVADIIGLKEFGSWGYMSSQYAWIYNTTYWLGSAGTYNGLCRVATNGYLDGNSYYDYSNNWEYGIRPVITISSAFF